MNPGDKVENFTLQNQDDKTVNLTDFKGKPVVLFFYPRADTPGCTVEACGFRDDAADYQGAGVTVLGVSPDSVGEVKKFADKFHLGYPLLADADHAVAESYGVWAEKSMYGRTYWGNLRATFIIDADGTIAAVIPKASPKTHDDVVLAALADLA